MPVPGETVADLKKQADISRSLFDDDAQRSPDCQRRKIINTQVIKREPYRYTEVWIMDRCGTRVEYFVTHGNDRGSPGPWWHGDYFSIDRDRAGVPAFDKESHGN